MIFLNRILVQIALHRFELEKNTFLENKTAPHYKTIMT